MWGNCLGTATDIGELEIWGYSRADEVKKQVFNRHHIVYPSGEHTEQEYVVEVRKCEHLLLTRLNWYCRKTVSRGFIRALKIWIAMNEWRAV
jgi:hypothetical protein